MSRLEKSRFMYVSDDSGFCDCCEEEKEHLLLLVTVYATIAICKDCFPSVMHEMKMKFNSHGGC